jgi:octaprenyl-diphosphate synthase
MATLNEIKKPVEFEISEFEKYFQSSLESKIPLLKIVLNYILRRKGKQMRPLFVLLSAKTLGNITPSSYVAASLIELLHTSSLIHDDVVDESYERRGAFSVNALWKSKISVLVGDFLLAQGLLLSVKNKTYDLLEIVSDAVKEMSEGELLQIQKSRKLDITESQYYEIIEKKTASLIAACTACGAKSVTDDLEIVDQMKSFGKLTGIAFQIKDDLLDYEPKGMIGKPTGNDIKEKKLTLPLIYALGQTTTSSKKSILRIINKPNKNQARVNEVIEFVKSNNGIGYAIEKMHDYKNQALEILNAFDPSSSRQSLIDLVNFTVERKK